MNSKHSRSSRRLRIAGMAAGTAVVLTISGGLVAAVVRAADDAEPTTQAAVADRYVVTVSGMT